MDDPTAPCRAAFAEHTRHLFVDVAQAGDIARGTRPARRAVFRKVHGIARGALVLDPARPAWARAGLWAEARYPCWVRFSSDVPPDQSDTVGATVGIGIKLFDIVGPTTAAVDPDAPTADLLLQNSDVFFVDTGTDMCAFTALALAGREAEWHAAHPETQPVLDAMNRREESVLTATYSSTLPYRCGAVPTVKYRLAGTTSDPSRAAQDDPDRLRHDLATRLAAGPAALTLALQVPREGWIPPIERATHPWPEADAPFTTIGELVLDRQDIAAEGQERYGDTLAFSPWRVPAANAPLGSLAGSRRLAYPASAAFRHHVNGVPEAEPHQPRELHRP